MGTNVEKEVELCPSAKVLYEALKNVATGQDNEDLSFIVGAHRTFIRALGRQDTTPAVKEARRKAEEAFAACLRAYGDRILDGSERSGGNDCGEAS